MPRNARLGRWLVHKGREYFNHYLTNTDSLPTLQAGEEEAFKRELIKSLAGQAPGLDGRTSVTMDEDEFQELQQRARMKHSSPPVPGAICDLRSEDVLAATIASFYAEWNPEKVEAAGRIASRFVTEPHELAASLLDKYPGARLGNYCPRGPGENESLPAAAPLSAYELAPTYYIAAASFVFMICCILAVHGAPLSQRPTAASRADTVLLALLACGAAMMAPGKHDTNAVVLAVGGAHLAWMFARRLQPSAPAITPPLQGLRQRRKDWYNY